MKRRLFFKYFSITWLTSCFPIILSICSPNKLLAQTITNKKPGKPSTTKIEPDFTVIGTVAELEKNGYLQTKEVAVLRNRTNPQKLIAVNPKCTHQGCDVKWVAEQKRYNCPCHDSNFEANGEVINGPATKPLAAYPAKIVGDRVLVKILPPPSVDPNQKIPTGRGGTIR
jgi:cytochrome b6-f complex iron-sulfur subunit